MNLTGVQAQLNGEDIKSIINEFVKVEGLELREVSINEVITVEGTFTKGLAVDFLGELQIAQIEDSKLTFRFSKLKLMKLGFFRPFRSLALKVGLSKAKVKGIDATKDRIIVDYKKLLIDVPFVDFNIEDIMLKDSLLHVSVKDINISIMGTLIKEEIKEEEKEEEENTEPIEKVSDYYTLGRDKLEGKLEEKSPTWGKFSDYLFVIPDLVALIIRLLKDSRVPTKTKIAVSAAIGYIVFPTDLIPDKIPLIGRIDEIGVLFFALNRIAKDVPTNVLLENWAGKDDLIIVLKNGLDYVTNFTGAKNVDKIYNVVEELSTL